MKLPIPVATISQHLVLLGKTRSGKSSKLRVLVEYLLSKNKRVLILTPKDDWWGLKLSADGKHQGFSMVQFGGQHADIPITAAAGGAVAELVCSGNYPCIISFKGWLPSDRTRFYNDLMAKLFASHHGELYIVLDEVHNFAPKGKVWSPDVGQMLHWTNTLATEGQGQGLILLAASQRPQKVHNDVLSQCETLVACRVTHKADRDAVKDWVNDADPKVGAKLLAEVADMSRAEAYVWSPEIGFGPSRIEWPMFTTYDSFKPQQGAKRTLKGWAKVDLDQIREKLSVAVQQAEENDPVRLQRRIRELEQELRKKPAAAPAPDPRELDRVAKQAAAGARREAFDLISAESSKMIASLARALVDGIGNKGDFPKVHVSAPALPSLPSGASAETLVSSRRASTKPRAAFMALASIPPPASNGALPKGEAAILTACIMYPEGISREHLTLLSGYKRSSRDAYILRLQQRGYIDSSDTLIRVTPAGQEALPNVQPLPTGQALRAHWLEKLPKGEREFLAAIIEAYPEAVRRDALDQVGYKRSSRDAYLQRLSARNLIIEPARGQVRASDNLF